MPAEMWALAAGICCTVQLVLSVEYHRCATVRQCKQRLAVIASASQLEATCCLCSVLVSQVLPWQPPSSARCLNALRYCRFAAKAAEKGGLLFAESLLKKIDREVGAFRAKLSESAAGADTITSMSWLPHRISGLANMPIVSFAQHAKFLLSSRHASQHAQSMILIVIRRFVCSGMVRSAVRARSYVDKWPWLCVLAEDAKAASPAEGKPAEQPAENADAASAAEPALEGQAAEVAAQAEAAASRRRVFRGTAPPATLLQDLGRFESTFQH